MTDMSLQQTLSIRRTCRDFDASSVPDETVRRLLWAAQGITNGSGKRTAPSAHALYPLSLMLTAGNIEGRQSGLYAVSREAETLELVRHGSLCSSLEDAALEDQPWIGCAAGIVTVCADFPAAALAFAEQPPLGERGARYVYIEAGAAAQNLQLQAAAEGLACVLVAGFQDEATSEVLGLNTSNTPVLHLCFGWPAET